MKPLSALLLALALNMAPAAAQERIQLTDGWQFRQARLNNWHPATVPGTVHTDLMAIGQIADPFFGLNERGVQWVDKEDWVYETTFSISAQQQARAHRELTFFGLDTYADVYLNDTLILQADNMFRTWRRDVSHLTREGQNRLRIYLHSPIKVDMPKWEAHRYEYPGDNDQSQNGGLLDRQLVPFARKAGYHYGWDWGPRLVTSGIWRPVTFTAWDDFIVRDIFVEQKEVTRKRAVVSHHVTIEATQATTVTVSVTDSTTRHRLARQTFALKPGTNEVTLPYTISNPKLWWCNGMGEPHLYTLLTEIKDERLKIKDEVTSEGKYISQLSSLRSALAKLRSAKNSHLSTRVGLRSIQLHSEPDAEGRDFYFVLNGEKVFMKGANYIPCDNFLTRVTDSVYRRTIDDAVAVNMNMLRIWGGGTYEDDRFYRLCDERGILIWHDFMFACGLYPATGAWLANVRQEAIDNVVRLRNHPCIALWCGNNECQDAWFNWGWKNRFERRDPALAQRLWQEFKDLYFTTLPQVVAQYAPQTSYRPSSPFATYDSGSKPNLGDYHYWEVWHGRKPISEYNKVRARFFSEYGMQSFPELASVRRFAPDANDWDIYSDVMMAHQRGGAHANALIENYLQTEYGKPEGFDTLLYVGQLMQGDAMKTAVEAHRRDKGYCWGTLLWQINDCWPVASWSTRDYYGRWKAAHYLMRPAMADILVSPIETDGRLHVFIVNDHLQPVGGQLTVQVWTADRLCHTVSQRVKVAANSSADSWQMPTDQLLAAAGIARNEAIVHAEFRPDNTTLKRTAGGIGSSYANNYILVYPKHLRQQAAPTLATTISVSTEGKAEGSNTYAITISTDRYARGIFLSLEGDADHHFADNYFDLLPGQQHTVQLTTCLSRAAVERNLHAMVYRSN